MEGIGEFVLSTLIEGLPIKFYSAIRQKSDFLDAVATVNNGLAQAIKKYLHDRDLVALYRSTASIDFDNAITPAFLRGSDINRLLEEMAKRFETTTPSIAQNNNPPSLYSICDYLNPLRQRQTYVLKTDAHNWMYEDLINRHSFDKILEIGIFYGGSTHAWRIRLPNADLFSIDINPPLQDNKLLSRVNCDFVQGSAIDSQSLDRLRLNAPYSLIIDDASHIPSHQIATFLYLSSANAWSDAYVIEDVHDSNNSLHPFTAFLSLVARLQEDSTSYKNFKVDVAKLLCEETIPLLNAIDSSWTPNILHRCRIIRYGDNYVFEL